MTMMRFFALGLGGMALATSLILPVHTVQAEVVGAAAAVRPSSTGTPPGGSSRTLQAGTKIVSQERIKTTGGGSLQVMFNDKSTMTIGPNSDLVIDKFVYNPKASGGNFAASLTKGALRFVGGQISHTTGATINTPVATLVIRGGAALVSHDSACQAKSTASRKSCTKVVCTGGACSVKSRINSRTFQLRINQAVEVGGLGAVEFNVSSVTLNDVAKGGSGGIVVGRTKGDSAKFNGKSTIDRTIIEQSPEPPPPPPP
ncbi:FecR family protein [Bauldia litoralis]|uniref:FecR family protein n=2 Tax=Bauldia litoralis TaxID=665467 RepID=UPI003263C94D